MRDLPRSIILAGLVFLCLGGTGQAGWLSGKDEVRIAEDSVVRDVVLYRTDKGDPPVKRRFAVVTIENRYLKLIICPELGERILNVVDKTTGRKMFYEGTIKYSGDVFRDAGMTTGGIHVNHPHYHCGSAHINPLPYKTEKLADGTGELTMAFTSYPHLQRTVWRISLRPDEAAFHLAYRFENLAPYPMGFNPWINAACELRPDTQFILPAEWVADHWFGINDDKLYRLDPWPVDAEGRDQSYLAKSTRASAFGYGVIEGFCGIYYHDADAGHARVFDPGQMPAAKEFGVWNTNNSPGWCEVWGAFSHNMEDPLWIAPHETIEGADTWFPIHGIRGMTWADDSGAVNLKKDGTQLALGVFMPRDHGPCALRLVADGNPMIQAECELSPAKPFFRTVSCPDNTDEVRLTVTDGAGRVLLTHHRFFAPRPRPQFVLPDKPWHRRTLVTQARWQEAFTPMMSWGPWYHPPKTYADALAANPGDIEAQIGRARSLIKEATADLFRGRNPKIAPEDERKEAQEILGKLAAADLPDPRALLLLALVQQQQNRPADAAQTLARLAGSANDGATVHYWLGLMAAGRGDWKPSAKEARLAVTLAPDSTLPRLLLAVGLLKTGHGDEARDTVKPLLEANPVEVGALDLLRRAAEAARRSAEAKTLAAELARLQTLAPGQYAAGMAELKSLESGQDLDGGTINTMKGPEALPGREP